MALVKFALVAALLSMACGGVVEPSPGDAPGLGSVYTYSAEPGLERATLAAEARLSEATGLYYGPDPLTIATPIVYVDPAENTAWDEELQKEITSCAQTVLTSRTRHSDGVYLGMLRVVIQVSDPQPENCNTIARVLEHEMIHNARRSITNRADRLAHSESGLFQSRSNPEDSKLDSTSLAMLCDVLPCLKFEAER